MALFVRKLTFATQFCDVFDRVFPSLFYLKAVFPRFQTPLFSSSACSSTTPALSRHLPQQKTAQMALLNSSALFLCTV